MLIVFAHTLVLKRFGITQTWVDPLFRWVYSENKLHPYKRPDWALFKVRVCACVTVDMSVHVRNGTHQFHYISPLASRFYLRYFYVPFKAAVYQPQAGGRPGKGRASLLKMPRPQRYHIDACPGGEDITYWGSLRNPGRGHHKMLSPGWGYHNILTIGTSSRVSIYSICVRV